MFDKTQYSVGLFLNCLARVSDDRWLLQRTHSLKSRRNRACVAEQVVSLEQDPISTAGESRDSERISQDKDAFLQLASKQDMANLN